MRLLVVIIVTLQALLGFNQGLAQGVEGELGITWDDTPLDRSNALQIISFADMLEDVTPGVVSVYSRKFLDGNRYNLPPEFQNDPFLRRFFGIPDGTEEGPTSEGLGSGVIVSANGYILTNNHVIEGADEVSVRLNDGREFEAEIIGADSKTDVAVLKVNGIGLPTLVLADSEQSRVGDIVFAVGNPLRVGLTVTQGIVSATNRTSLSLIEDGGYENFLQTDASINPGNSGGPLVDAKGRVLGLNTAILSQSGGSIGIGFAIPSNLVRNVMTSLIETGEVRRGYLGIAVDDLTQDLAEQFGVPTTNGALVTQIHPGTPAESAGIQVGDVVVGMNNKAVVSRPDLRLKVSQITPGERIELEIVRDGNSIELPITLGSLDDIIAGNQQFVPHELLDGIELFEVNDALRQQFRIGKDIAGLVVTNIHRDSPYREKFQPGMVILGVNRQKISTIAEAMDLMSEGKNMLYVYFQGQHKFMVIQKV